MSNLLYQAVVFLAGNCDGARRQDNAGFNRIDSDFGKALSTYSWEIWTPRQKRAAWKMLSKYRKQLESFGIDYSAIPEPPETREDKRSVCIKYGNIEIAFGYSKRLVEAVRQLPHRRWNGSVWTLPMDSEHAAAAVAFARTNDFEYSDEVQALAERANGESRIELPVKTGRTVKAENDQAVIRFDFDADLVAAIKRVPGASWRKEMMAWIAPYTPEALVALNEFISDNGFSGDTERLAEFAGKITALQAEAIEASKAATADFEVEGLGGVLRPFQKAGAKYAAEKKRCLIADQPGLGKTCESLATVQALNAFPVLIECPASLKLNWYKEVRTWLPQKTINILGSDGIGRLDAAITIINYDQLKKYRDYLVQREFKAVICDESHLLKSAKTLRASFTEEIMNGCIYARNKGKIDRRSKERLRAAVDVRLLLTGTPILNRPEELISQLQILDRLKEFGGWYGFTREFCGLEFTRFGVDASGAKNLDKLHDRLRATCMVRRTKAEVLTELPAKQITVVPLELSNRPEYIRAEANLIAWLKETKGAAKADAAMRAEQLVRIGALKQLTARGKMAAFAEWAADFTDTDEKLVSFGWHKETVQTLAQLFKCDAIYGDIAPGLRQPMVDRFQEDPAIKNIVLNIQSGGLGLTLTAASNCAILELPWNPGSLEQAIDRLHRIGQRDSVTAWIFLGTKTIDEDIFALIEEKRSVVDAATDGAEQVQNVGVMNELIDRLTGESPRHAMQKDQGSATLFP